jgi:hypothetical protein
MPMVKDGAFGSCRAAGAHHASPLGRSPFFVRSKASFWVLDLDKYWMAATRKLSARRLG